MQTLTSRFVGPIVPDNRVKFDSFGCFPNFDKCLSEVAGDVISGVAVELVGMDVRMTCGESGLNSGRNI